MQIARKLYLFGIRASRYTKGQIIGRIWQIRGADVTDRIIIEGLTPALYAAGSLTIGSRVLFRAKHDRAKISVAPRANVRIGNRVFINGGCIIDSSVSIEIGDRCLLGEGCEIRDSNYHEIDEGRGVKKASVRIGRNVWLGNNAMILPGVEIGDHCVVAACSVVTKSIPDRTLVAGNPARVVRSIEASDNYIRA